MLASGPICKDQDKGDRQMAEKKDKKCSEIGREALEYDCAQSNHGDKNFLGSLRPKRTDSQLERYQQSLLIVILILLALMKIK